MSEQQPSRQPLSSLKDLEGLECYPIVLMIDQMFEEVYLVGGAVRDEIMGIETYDLDFAVPYTTDRIGSVLSAKGLPVRDNAVEFGTIATHAGLYDIQITSYRDEQYAETSRKPTVRPAPDIDSDLARRDFTINAMALGRNEFIDPYGGVSDIGKKLIRTVGDAAKKMNDDPLRIMRAYRFVSLYGFNIDKHTLTAIEMSVDLLMKVSNERLADEFQKTLLGEYWMDALYEMATSKLLSTYMRRIGFSAPVRPSSVSAVTDQYSNAELRSMQASQRWMVFFEILTDAERGRGIRTLDTASLVGVFAPKMYIKKSLVTALLDNLTNAQKNAGEVHNKVALLQDELHELELRNDPRSLIVKSKLFFEQGKVALIDRSYARAAKLFKDAVTCNDADIDFIVKHYQGVEKDAKLVAVKKYYIERYSYYLSAKLLHERWQLKYTKADDALKAIRRQIGKARSLSADEDMAARVQSVARVYRYASSGFSDQSYLDFLEAWAQRIPTDTYDYLVGIELHRQLTLPSVTISERVEVYKKLVHIAKERTLNGQYGLDYYDPLLDLRFWQTIAADTLKIFWAKYDALEAVTDDYIKLARRAGREQSGMRRAYLNSAAALTHGLSLTNDLSEKVELSRSIVASYIMAGYRSSKSVLRFKVLLGWLGFVKSLNDGNATIGECLDVINRTLFDYIDIDEEYFTHQLASLAHARDNLRAARNCLVALSGDIDCQMTGVPVLDAVIVLVRNDMLVADQGFVVLRNYCLKETLEKYERVPFITDSMVNHGGDQSETERLIEGGENDKLELKAGWRYSQHKQCADKSISAAIVRTIAAFMNSEGGVVVIGVQDDHAITGLENTDFLLYPNLDVKKRLDKVCLGIDDVFAIMIGTQHSYLKIVRPECVNDKTLLVIKVEPSRTPVYVREPDGGEEGVFYIRGTASTRRLPTSSAVEYIGTHFHLSSSPPIDKT